MNLVLPLADHGNVVSALPFVLPMLAVVVGLAVMVARDRLSSRHGDGASADRRSSHG